MDERGSDRGDRGDKRGTARIGSPEASLPMPVPKALPPVVRVGGRVVATVLGCMPLV